jgi:molybdopterin synthase catalytic subunit
MKNKRPTLIILSEEPIRIEQYIKSITTESCGAICIFTGIVRGFTEKNQISQTLFLEYETYQVMAEEKMRQIANEIRSRWPLIHGICIAQRIGKLNVGKTTVIIACSSAHRDDGIFDGARYGIDRLKEIVPIWKKEVGKNGEEWIEGEYIPRQGE